MARRYRESENPVSLFPFLAVLICAMGVLIFLLIVSTSRIRSRLLQQAIQHQKKKEKPKAAPKPIVQNLPKPVLPSLQKTRRAPREMISPAMIDPNRRMKQRVVEIKNNLARERAKRNRLEAEMKSKMREKNLLEKEILAKRKLVDLSEDEYRKRTLRLERLSRLKTDLTRAIFVLRKNIDEQKRKRAEVSSKFKIVPFEGRTGTTRRPILIECDESGLTLLPEGITLSLANLEGFSANKNPLLSSVKTLITYWHNKDKAESGNPNEPFPYVLLLVRPSGSLPFYAARKMLSKLDVSFGYELIDEDWKLALPDSDQTAIGLARHAIRETIREGRFLQGRNRPATKFSNNGPIASNGRSIRFHKNTGTFEVVESNNSSGKGSNSRSRSGKVGTSLRSFGQPSKRATFSKSANRGSQTFPSSSSASRSGRSFSRTQGNSFRKPKRLGSFSRNDATRIGDGSGNDQTHAKNRQENLRNSHPLAERKGEDRLQAGTSQGSTNKRHSSGNRSADLADIKKWKTREQQRKSGSGQSRDTEVLSRRGNIERDFFNTSPNGTRKRNPQVSSTANPDRSRSGHSSGSQSYSNSQFVPVPNPFAPRKSKSPSLELIPQKSRWGFSSARSSIGFEREVTVWVNEEFAKVGTEDIFAVASEKTRTKEIGKFVGDLERNVRSWGFPPERFYWIPSIRFVVYPGGTKNVRRLKSIADKMHLPSKIEFSSQPKQTQRGKSRQ